jgi:predicted transcriptional regulator
MFKYLHKKEHDDFHIRILRYAYKNPGFTLSEIERDENLSKEQVAFLLYQLQKNEFFDSNGLGYKDFNHGNSNELHKHQKTMLNFEGRMRLLEYDELKEARENARGAFWMALLALIVSSVGVFFQVLYR